MLDICTILLGLAVGASTSAQVFLNTRSVMIFALGCVAFVAATVGGVIFAKIMNVFSTDKVNPLIGAAGVSAVPDSARVAHMWASGKTRRTTCCRTPWAQRGWRHRIGHGRRRLPRTFLGAYDVADHLRRADVCEGRDEAFVQSLHEKLEAVPGLVVLDVSMDHVGNRTVFSFTGGKQAIFEGGFLLYQEALERIDMRQHRASTRGSGRSTCSRLSLAERAALNGRGVGHGVCRAGSRAVPVAVYLFADAARSKLRRNIENIREGEYEGFAARSATRCGNPIRSGHLSAGQGRHDHRRADAHRELQGLLDDAQRRSGGMGRHRALEPGHGHTRRSFLPRARSNSQCGAAQYHGGQLRETPLYRISRR